MRTLATAHLLVVCGAALSCVGSTGGGIVAFHAAAAGPVDVGGGPLTFDTGRGWRVLLTRATLHIGGVYMNRSVPTSGAQDTSCILPGIYVGEVTAGLDVDALSPDPQPFASAGEGTAEAASTGELWLTGGDVNAVDDPTVIADVAGTASQAGTSFPFEATVTIGANRAVAVSDPSQPGAHPPCKPRIVTPIPIAIAPTDGGTLLVRVDPRGWFSNVDFSQLKPTSTAPALYVIPDDGATEPGQALFDGLRASAGVYSFTWQP